VDPGHAFAYLLDDAGVVTNILSVGPASPIGALNKRDFLDGNLDAVSNWPLSGEITAYQWKIDPAQYRQCTSYFSKMKAKPGKYSPDNQCTSAAVMLARQCGVRVPSGASPVQVKPVPPFFGGYKNSVPNPYGLDSQLGKAMSSTRLPSSSFQLGNSLPH